MLGWGRGCCCCVRGGIGVWPPPLRQPKPPPPTPTPTPTPQRLPDKIAADRDGRLVAFAHSDVGMLNNVVELWRYPSAAACIRCVR
jgi:hypothetical protein